MPVRRAALAIVSRRPKKLPPASLPFNLAPSQPCTHATPVCSKQLLDSECFATLQKDVPLGKISLRNH